MSTLEMRLHAAHKARLARFADAATKHNVVPFEITVLRKPPEPVLPPISNDQIKEAHAILQAKGLLNQVDIIQRAVLTKFPKVSITDIKSRRRDAAVVLPRQIGMYLCKELTNKSLPDIGRRFGGRDHTTVIHSVNKITGMILDDEEFAQLINSIRELI